MFKSMFEKVFVNQFKNKLGDFCQLFGNTIYRYVSRHPPAARC